MRGNTFTSYSNAYGLFIGSKDLGLSLTVADGKPIFPIPVNRHADLGEWLLFTEEASLGKALRGEIRGKFHPKNFPENLLDDKWALAAWLAHRPHLTAGLTQWDLAAASSATFPCLLKAKKSWQGAEKMPRGWICESAADLKEKLENAQKMGFPADSFFIQEWLGDSFCRVLSVCGFHDHRAPERNLVAVVERIAAHNKGLSCSSAIETIDDEWCLIEKASAILNALEFTGPYELEFLENKNRVCVLELNPRFWLQHSIFLKTKNGVIKRYLGTEDATDRTEKILRNVTWFDGVELMKSVLLGDFKLFNLFRAKNRSSGRQVLIWPPISVVCFAGVRVFWRKMFIRLSRMIFKTNRFRNHVA